MSAQIPTSLLRMARETASLSQSQLATALEVSASVVSRLESTEFADSKMAERYLSAVGTDLSKQIIQYYHQHWRHIERPPFTHPEREVLRAAEEAIQTLDKFEKGPQFDAILQDPLFKLKDKILSETEYVRHMEHGLSFIGNIGVGKTTALSFVTNLVTDDKHSKPQSVFPTGSGRTTVCEVAIKIAPAYGIAVESLAEEDIRLLVTDLVTGLKTSKSGLPSELERVIRNMANLRRITVRPKDDDTEKPKPIDHLKDMVDAADNLDEVIAEVMSRMKLDSRTEAQMILSENAENSLDWLSTNISKINYGQHPGFSVPQRITILLPLKALRETPYLLSVIDTKGVEGTTQRPDLKAQIDDPRTVTVLCTKFSDAPGSTPISIMREIIDSGSDALDSERLCLLVLPQKDEALKIVDDSGCTPESIEEGYAVRESQIDQQFATEGLTTIPTHFFNIETDNPEVSWRWLTSRIKRMRANKVNRINHLINAAHDLVNNSDAAKTRQARRTIADTLTSAADRFKQLPNTVRQAHQNLITQTKKSHQSSIAASISRRGNWDNFPIPHILGVGVRTDANLRTRDTFVRIDEQIESLKEKYSHLLDVKQILDSLKDDLDEWKQDFLARAALTGRVCFSAYLKSAKDLWKDCEARYGAGVGYRVDISDIFQEYFENDQAARDAANKVELALTKIWIEVVIDPLKEAVNFEGA